MKIFLGCMTLGLLLVSCASQGQSVVVPAEDITIIPTQAAYEGVGTEPFWAFRFVDGDLLWQEPGENGTESYSASGTMIQDNALQNIAINAGNFSATLTADASCSDGMSENTYTYKVSVIKDTRNFSGCAREYVAQ